MVQVPVPGTALLCYSHGLALLVPVNTMTALPAKSQDTDKNAFEVLMETAHMPGVFALFLEDNPWKFEGDWDIYENWSNLNHYDSRGKYDYDPAFRKAMEDIENETVRNSPIDCDSSGLSEKETVDFFLNCFPIPTIQLLDDKDKTPKSNVPVRTPVRTPVRLPPPLTEPTLGASIESLTVCFGRSKKDLRKEKTCARPVLGRRVESSEYWSDGYSSHEYSNSTASDSRTSRRPVLGFIVSYSDGLQIQIGSLRGSSFEATLALSPGEGISKLSLVGALDANYHLDDQDDHIYLIYLETNNEAHFIIQNGQVKVDSGGECSTNYSSKYPHTAKNAKLLNDISKLVLGSTNRKHVRPVKKHRTDANMTHDAKHQKIQPLIEMYKKEMWRISGSAQHRLLQWFLNNNHGRLSKLCAVEAVEESNYASRKYVREKQRNILQLNDCDERQRLQQFVKKLIKGVHFHTGVLKREFQPRIREFKKSFKEERKNTTGNHESKQLVCDTCLCLFNPLHVRSRKRCDVSGCFDDRPNCGCAVWECVYCLVPYCNTHRDSHTCKDTLKTMCGWRKGNHYLSSDFCGSLVEDKGKCFDCKVLCCENCRILCKGSSPSHSKTAPCPSNTLWCTSCAETTCWAVDKQCHKCWDIENGFEDSDNRDEEEEEDSSFPPEDSDSDEENSF